MIINVIIIIKTSSFKKISFARAELFLENDLKLVFSDKKFSQQIKKKKNFLYREIDSLSYKKNKI